MFYNPQTEEFGSCGGQTQHSMNQLWRFERAAGYPKGIHAIVSVATGQMIKIVEGLLEDGRTSYDFLFELDEEDSAQGLLSPDSLFIIFMDKDSEYQDILIKPYNTEPMEDMFLCVQLDNGAIDICRRSDWIPTRFVLNIPAV